MKVLLLVLALVFAAAIPLALLVFYGMSEVRQLVLREIDLSKIEDGTYVGSYHKGRFTYDVEVAIRDHRIIAIKNKNPRTRALGEWNEQAEAAIGAGRSLPRLDVRRVRHHGRATAFGLASSVAQRHAAQLR